MDPLFSRDVIYFAKTDYRNANRLFGVKRKDRRQHMYVVGKTGVGKTALLHNIAVQDIVNGEGLCVVDPHGEFVESLLAKIPKSRMKDVIYFNPADADFNLGFNVLELPDPKYKHLVASGLMAIFTKIWANVWSARMEYIMNNAILALLETPGTTLLGISRILVDKDYRQRIVANVKDPVVRAFWVNEYETWRDQFRNEAIAPIQNKVGQFLSTAMIRNVVGQRKSTIDIFDIMNTNKIFLVNVSKGRIGEDNSSLLGAMLITKIQLSAMERVRIPEEDRQDFYLYVDEFQNFATDSFAGILSEARKYRLNLVLAHQYIGQLVTDVSTKVRDAVFGNVGTMIVFRVGATDAEFLENEFAPEFVPQDIVNLPNHAIYLKLMVNGITSRPFSAETLPPFKVTSIAADPNEIIEMSRKLYALPTKKVEDEITRWSTSMGDSVETVTEFRTERKEEPKSSAPAKKSSGNGSASGERYPITCSLCGKQTTVSFKPTPGRPVYCSECFEKVKVDQAQAASARETRETERKAAGELAALGIEFEAPVAPKERRSEVAASRPERQRPSIVGGGEVVPRAPKGKEGRREETISLSSLGTPPNQSKSKKSEKEKRPGDVAGLREALKKALEGK